MGLDSNIVKGTIKKNGKMVAESVWYGRKQNEIHGWMQKKSGIPAEEFNGGMFPITEELLKELESDMAEGLLEHTSGFFFGSANSINEIVGEVQKITEVSRAAHAKGEIVAYTSWW